MPFTKEQVAEFDIDVDLAVSEISPAVVAGTRLSRAKIAMTAATTELARAQTKYDAALAEMQEAGEATTETFTDLLNYSLAVTGS